MEPVGRERIRVCAEQGDVEREDAIAVEEPLRIRVRSPLDAAAVTFATTMRTPGDDADLASGLLFTEGAVARPEEILSIAEAEIGTGERRGNTLTVTLSPEAFERARRLRRETVVGSACGICGSDTIEETIGRVRAAVRVPFRLSREVLHALPGRLRERQSVFAATGGLHGAAVFDGGGALTIVREDIGRHNATDKVIGSALRDGRLPLSGSILLVSGRAGFEIVQKAFAAGVPVVASVSAPSSLAVALADAGGITLVGFLREKRFNVYAHPERLDALLR
ncbi:MAG TPA: formate dehydrogenase accessory sulfurtransferase FdhD [Thermoanaerobaculia bacterium]|nr:formate dehydrogenase accessory sulfurtransferase FdhD [Thermoanaerobaculia bacterium]